ncbi:MAG: hypothetical protein KVP17_000038 [Porospora cf. gigantea B]|nr:MAG: hypothetical protein KVP17_000038 [Porospora cf. gigantea B]
MLSATMAANPEWLNQSVNEKTPINGVTFEDFMKRFADHNLRRAGATDSGVDDLVKNCDVRFELAINQDVSGSFSSVLTQFQQKIDTLVSDVTSLYPGSRVGFSTFTDKPIPISGFGEHGDYPSRYYRDHCYKLRSPLTADSSSMFEAISDVKISGGGDYFENLLGSLVSVGRDAEWGFTKGLTGGYDDDTAMIRVVLSTTDALPHVAGDAKRNVQKWNVGWGTQDFEESWTLHYGACKKGGPAYGELVNLRSKYEAGSLSGTEADRFDALRGQCGPWEFSNDFLPHGGVVDSPDNCLTHEYPTVADATDAVKQIDAVVPVMITPSANAGLSFVRYYGHCPTAETEPECLREHYQTLFQDAGLNGLFYSLEGTSVPGVNDIILFALESIKYLYCRGDLFTTATPSNLPTTLPHTSTKKPTTCVCVGNVCPCDDEMRVHVGVDVPVSKWEAFVKMFSPWVEANKP